MKSNIWNPCSEQTQQSWQNKLWFSIWRIFEHWETIMHYVTDQPAIISKIYPKLQVLTFHFFEVDELLNENWAKIVRSENISTPIHVQCDKMYRSKVCVILVYRVWPWYSTWAIQERQPCTQKIGSRLWETTIQLPFFPADRYKAMAYYQAQLLRLLTLSPATWIWFPQVFYLQPQAFLHGTEPVSVLTLALLYCCSL